jgi:hypothetical protein
MIRRNHYFDPTSAERVTMENIALLLTIVCILYVIYWSIKNDSVASIDQQTGFLKMRLYDKVIKGRHGAIQVDTNSI